MAAAAAARLYDILGAKSRGLMRIMVRRYGCHIWIIIAILLVLFAVTRYVMHEREISHICVNDPSAPECQR